MTLISNNCTNKMEYNMSKDESFEITYEFDDNPGGEVPAEILDLARFLSAVVTKAHDVRYMVLAEKDPLKAMDILRKHFPIVQGLKNLDAIYKIARQTMDSKNISTAVDWMLENE